MKKVTISDIANQLDVSRNTVSKVMNERGHVSTEMKKRVIETALEMEYDKIPKNILEKYGDTENKLQKTKTQLKNILVVATAPDVSDFWVKMINGITNHLVKDDYRCLYNFITFEQAENFEFPELINKKDISGIIVINVYNKDTVKKIAQNNIPTVYFDIPLRLNICDIKADVVIIEGRNSIYQITNQLFENGDKKLGFIGDINYCKSIEERWQGFVRAHDEADIEIDRGYCITAGEEEHFYFEEEIEDILEKMIKKGSKMPDAFVCANDSMAYRVIKKLKEFGYNVPKDIRVSGFDDMDHIEWPEKILTTVSINVEELGERLAEQMVWRIKNTHKHFEEVKMCGKIKFRESTSKQ